MSKANSCFRKVTHCIFDMDGLLLDTEKLYTEAIQTILSRYGKTYSWEVKLTMMGMKSEDMARKMIEIYELPMTWQEYAKLQADNTKELFKEAQLLPDTERIYEMVVRQIAGNYGKEYPLATRLKIMGTTDKRSAEIAVQDLNLPITVDEYLKTYHELCRKSFQGVQLMKGAERLLRHLHQHKVPIALATSSSEPAMQIKITNHKALFELFHHRVCGSTDPSVKRGKPHPDIFLVAAERFSDKPQPAQCLVFEDAPNGVKAASDACMQSVMVPDPRVPEEMRCLATLVLKSLEEFQPELFGLPAFPVATCN